MRGTWRVAAYTDPKGPPVGEATLPGRGLCARAARGDADPEGARRCGPGQPAAIDVSARYLYGAPGAGLDVSGEVAVAGGDEPASRASRASRSASTTRRSRPRPPRSKRRPSPTPRAARPAGPASRRLRRPRPTRGAHHAARRRARRARGRAQHHPADPAQRARCSASKKLSAATSAKAPPRPSTSSSRARRHAPRAQGRGLDLCQGRTALSMVQQRRRWGYEPVKATRRVADGTLDIDAERARPGSRPRWSGAATGWRSRARRRDRADQRLVHGRLVRRSDRRHARPPRHDARQGELRRRRDACRLRLNAALRRQGDARGRERPGP